MRFMTSCAAALLLLGTPLVAQDPKPAKAGFEAEYDKLVADHEAAQQKFYAEMRKRYEDEQKKAKEAEAAEAAAKAKADAAKPADGKDGDDKPKTVKAVKATAMIGGPSPESPTVKFIPKFEDLATRAKGTDTAVKSLTWLLTNGQEGSAAVSSAAPAAKPAENASDRALKTLLGEYVTSPAMDETCAALQHIGYGETVSVGENALRKVLAATPHRTVKAAAMSALAQLLQEDEGVVYKPQENGEWKKEDLYTADKLAKRKAEAKDLMLAMRKEFSDTPAFAPVAAILFDVEHLQVGMAAPDFTAKDVDGKEFKLSDYRGKIVMIDFWGFW